MIFTWGAYSDESAIGLVTLKETRHHYPSGGRDQNARPGTVYSSDIPDDIDTDVEESHEESYVASSQHH